MISTENLLLPNLITEFVHKSNRIIDLAENFFEKFLDWENGSAVNWFYYFIDYLLSNSKDNSIRGSTLDVIKPDLAQAGY